MTRKRCLWIARDVPFPLDSGDKIYTANLASSVAAAGIEVSMLAHAGGPHCTPPVDWGVRLETIAGGKRPQWQALASLGPLASAVHPTRNYRKRLQAALAETWDCIVVDQLGSVWAIDAVERFRRRNPNSRVVYVSHNHEATLWRGMAEQFEGSLLRRFAMWQNAWKAARAEQRLARSVDLITTITREDSALYGADSRAAPRLVLTPGYSGHSRERRVIDAQVPRRVILIGSFRWVVKQENLRRFVAAADARFAASAVRLDVVGDVPAELRAELEPQLKATTLHGFVDDIRALMNQARIAVVPEMIGGGFKLKFLDYLFMRLPVATIAAASAGLPLPIREQMMQFNSLDELAEGLVAQIDDVVGLDRRQNAGYDLAQTHYQWADRGRDLAGWLASR